MRDDRLNQIFDGTAAPTSPEEQLLADVKRDLQSLHASTPDPQLGFERVKRAIEAVPSVPTRALKWNWLHAAFPAVAACALGLWMISSNTTKDTLKQSTQARVVTGRVVPNPPTSLNAEVPPRVVESAPMIARVMPESKREDRSRPKSVRRNRSSLPVTPKAASAAKKVGLSDPPDATFAAASSVTPGILTGSAASDTMMATTTPPSVASTVVIISAEVTATGTQAAVERMGVSDVVVGG